MKKILVVDSMPSKYVEDLILAGYVVECVPCGAQAIRSIMEYSGMYAALIVTSQVEGMKPFTLVKWFMRVDQHTVRAIIPIILVEKHGAHVSQSWFVITPNDALLVRNALQELLGVLPPEKEERSGPRGFLAWCFPWGWAEGIWWRLGISW